VQFDATTSPGAATSSSGSGVPDRDSRLAPNRIHPAPVPTTGLLTRAARESAFCAPMGGTGDGRRRLVTPQSR
jgi:hypothetical protein